MPIDVIKTSRECPNQQCKSKDIFKSSKGYYYCINCNNEFVLKEDGLEIQSPTDRIVDPMILITN